MIPLSIHLDAEGMAAGATRLLNGEWTDIGALDNGTDKGRPIVAVMLRMPDGTVVLGQTTMRLFQAAARAFAARYPDDGTED